MADESKWSLIWSRARAAGMSVLQFVIEHAVVAARPNIGGDDLPMAVHQRAIVELCALALVQDGTKCTS